MGLLVMTYANLVNVWKTSGKAGKQRVKQNTTQSDIVLQVQCTCKSLDSKEFLQSRLSGTLTAIRLGDVSTLTVPCKSKLKPKFHASIGYHIFLTYGAPHVCLWHVELCYIQLFQLTLSDQSSKLKA